MLEVACRFSKLKKKESTPREIISQCSSGILCWLPLFDRMLQEKLILVFGSLGISSYCSVCHRHKAMQPPNIISSVSVEITVATAYKHWLHILYMIHIFHSLSEKVVPLLYFLF
ncbi:hypothetical protein ACQJBY_048350 [Aegilops geniculata]